MEYFEITVTVDTNDADYITLNSKISGVDLEKIKPLIGVIKNFKTTNYQHNFPTGECLREDLGEKPPNQIYDFPEEIFELFDEILPSFEYGFHTIESIYVTPYVEKTRLL